MAQLESSWHALAQLVHPDRYANAGEAEKRVALMTATRVNEAYQTLRSPAARARYLLQLAGIDTQEDSNTSMPSDFLMAQIEWRERIEEAHLHLDIEALQTLAHHLSDEIHYLDMELARALDSQHDLDAATLLVRKRRFLEKLDQEISNTSEALLLIPHS